MLRPLRPAWTGKSRIAAKATGLVLRYRRRELPEVEQHIDTAEVLGQVPQMRLADRPHTPASVLGASPFSELLMQPYSIAARIRHLQMTCDAGAVDYAWDGFHQSRFRGCCHHLGASRCSRGSGRRDGADQRPTRSNEATPCSIGGLGCCSRGTSPTIWSMSSGNRCGCGTSRARRQEHRPERC